QILVCPQRGDVPVKRVAAFLGDGVHPDPGILRLGIPTIGADADFLNTPFVHVEGHALPPWGAAAIRHAVDRAVRFRDAAAVYRQAARRGAVDVLSTDDAWNRLREALNLPVVREVFDDLLVVDGAFRRALNVDERRLAGDGDRLIQFANFQVGIHRSGEIGAKIEILDFDSIKTGQCEGDRVDAGPQIDDSIKAGGVRGH